MLLPGAGGGAARRVFTGPACGPGGVLTIAAMTVHFISAGPGAADLLTLRASALIARCPVCLYAGSLVPRAVLAHCPAGARIVNTAALGLDEIVAEIQQAHARGQDVARLHSGDLAVYSAMGEQLRRLRALGIACTVTPGVPAFAAAAAALQAELTLPGLVQSVVLTRTPGRASAMPPAESLPAFAATGAVLALHLSIHAVADIQRELLAHYGADCPVAVVWRASWPDEHIVRTPLHALAQAVARAQAQDPRRDRTALILVGPSLGGAESDALRNFAESRLYAPDYDRRWRPRGAQPRFPDSALPAEDDGPPPAAAPEPIPPVPPIPPVALAPGGGQVLPAALAQALAPGHGPALTLIGIGCGNPAHLTLEAVRAMRSAHLILLPRKGGDRAELAALRRMVCASVLDGMAQPPRIAEFDMPERASEGSSHPAPAQAPEREAAPAASAHGGLERANRQYLHHVRDWHAQIARCWTQAIAAATVDAKAGASVDAPADGPSPGPVATGGGAALPALPDLRAALLVWGDPALYDSSLRIAAQMQPAARSVRVVPGISAVQLLAAAHGVALNTVGQPVLVTTARQLRTQGWPPGVDSVVVMLDGQCSFASLPEALAQQLHIWWGAYLGMPQQLLDSGPLPEAGARIRHTRARARQQHGWVMDIYLLRKLPAAAPPVSA